MLASVAELAMNVGPAVGCAPTSSVQSPISEPAGIVTVHENVPFLAVPDDGVAEVQVSTFAAVPLGGVSCTSKLVMGEASEKCAEIVTCAEAVRTLTVLG